MNVGIKNLFVALFVLAICHPAYASEPYEGIWAKTQKECLDEEGPNSRTLIDLGNLIDGKPSPLFDQYENHCKIENKTVARDGTTTLTTTCFEFWENFTKGIEGERTTIKLSPRKQDSLGIDGSLYQRCAAARTKPTVASSSANSADQITSLSAFANQLKHQWVKYDESNNGARHQNSYIDVASIIRTGDTVTVLDLQDQLPFLEVGTTGERLGSLLMLVRYDCGSTARSMIMASVNFHGHMATGTQQQGAADIPKEPYDGWYVMPARTMDGKANSMVKARDMACNSLPSSRQ